MNKIPIILNMLDAMQTVDTYSFFCSVESRTITSLCLKWLRDISVILKYIFNAWNLEPKPYFRAWAYLPINRHWKKNISKCNIFHECIPINWKISIFPTTLKTSTFKMISHQATLALGMIIILHCKNKDWKVNG